MSALGPDEIHVHLVDVPEADAGAFARAHLANLPFDERERYDRYLVPGKRHEFLLTRVLCRRVLSEVLSVGPRSLEFVLGPYGKPALAERHGTARTLHFNMSNTDGLIACAVAWSRDVGVDVEHMDRRTDTLGVADRFFSESEVQRLFALPAGDAQRQRFFELWTLKEAYIKARGLGLAIPLGSFSFQLEEPGPPGIAFDATHEDLPRHWWFEQGFPTARHALALAARVELNERLRTTILWRDL